MNIIYIYYLYNDIEDNMVTHTILLEGNIFFQLLDTAYHFNYKSI